MPQYKTYRITEERIKKIEEKDYLTVNEVAEILTLSSTTIKKMINADSIKKSLKVPKEITKKYPKTSCFVDGKLTAKRLKELFLRDPVIIDKNT